MAVRKSTGNKYVEYEGGVRELYYLKSYPYELANRYGAAAALTTLAYHAGLASASAQEMHRRQLPRGRELAVIPAVIG